MILSSSMLSFCKEHETDDVHALALQGNLYPDINMQEAVIQIKGLQVAKQKLPSWYENDKVIYPKHLSLEQCSSESTALYKQQICGEGDAMVDLTGGFGVDISFMSQSFTKAMYVEEQVELCELAQSNFGVLGINNIEIKNAEASGYLETIDEVDLVYIDPARRDTKGRKTVLIEDCTPNLLEIDDVLAQKAKRVIIKLSPMLDISLALSNLKDISEVHIISVDNECKELLFVKQKETSESPLLHCVNIQKGEVSKIVFLRENEERTNLVYTTEIHSFLYEPNASIMKAGAYKTIVEQFEVEKLHVSSHLYTSDSYIDSFPGRKFRVKEVSSFNKKDVKQHLQTIDKANITIRNFPMNVEDLRRKLKLKDGGDTYIFATTLADNQKVIIICERL